ncbi:MAG: hypothetical protein NC082_05415 [Clostridiales bacterium]|nr:hypothetical protein [Clostridiales bacterium]
MKKLLLTFLAAVMITAFSASAAEPQVLLDADFTVLTAGTETAPVAIDKSALNKLVPSVYAYGSNSKNTYQAGGSLFLADGGRVEFGALSALPSYPKGTIRVTAEVKMGASTGGIFVFSNGTYASSKSVSEIIMNGEWNTITFYFSELGRTDRPNISPLMSFDGMFVKSLKIEYSADFVIPPVAYLPTDADGTSFTASCGRVTGASKYEMDVFSLDDKGEKVMFLENEPLTAVTAYSDTKKKVTGLDPATTYFYVVRAIGSNGNKSEDSNTVEVIRCISSLDAPEAIAAVNVTENGYTATWNGVENADSYVVNTYVKETTTQSSIISVLNEDFSGVTMGSLEQIDYSTDPLDNFTKEKGWITDVSKTYASGYYVMYPTVGKGVLITPVMNLSSDNGAFSVDLTCGVASLGTYYTSTNTLQVELIEADDIDKESTASIESSPAITFKNAAEEVHTFNFTKGTEACRLRISYDITPDTYMKKLFINEIDVKQEVPAGYVVERQLGNKAVSGATESFVELTQEEGKEYFFDVYAVGKTVVGTGASAEVGDIQSAASNRVKIGVPAGVDEVNAAGSAPKAWKAGDGVLGVNGGVIAVYDINGRAIYSNTINPDTYTIALGVNGLVIVVVDGEACKIVL